MLEECYPGEEESYYSWDVDKNYDPSLILNFELEYQRQEDDWPTESYKRGQDLLKPSISIGHLKRKKDMTYQDLLIQC